MSKVPVYDECGNVVARVEYNQNLDYWNGSNWTCGSTGHHRGLTKLKDGRFVLIHGTQWQGERDYADIISERRAIELILESDDIDNLLLDKRFACLRDKVRALEDMEE